MDAGFECVCFHGSNTINAFLDTLELGSIRFMVAAFFLSSTPAVTYQVRPRLLHTWFFPSVPYDPVGGLTLCFCSRRSMREERCGSGPIRTQEARRGIAGLMEKMRM